MGNGYIPSKDLTHPVDYAVNTAYRYDRDIFNKVAKFHSEEKRLLKKIYQIEALRSGFVQSKKSSMSPKRDKQKNKKNKNNRNRKRRF